MTDEYQHLKASVRRALEEDIGSGDVTAALVPDSTGAIARVIVREEAVLCGKDWFDEVFAQLNPDIRIDWEAVDGDLLQAEQTICRLQGSARDILTGERTALNFLQTLSGTASRTRHYVQVLAGTNCRVLDTRKTIPGLRLAQKYAVRCGGGTNHRIGLFDAILIKENHIASAGSIAQAVNNARKANPELAIEIEVENLQAVQEALGTNAERLLLDNFSLSELAEAVEINANFSAHQAELEASGGLTDNDLRAVAETGVDFISVGALTKHLRATDYSMRFTLD
ncbi:MAG: carboxylating nicotinate-nucleotide diphosphorylase [Pseudomonadota bacterium]